MNKPGTTKDELFMLMLYKIASARGDQFAEIDRYEVGKAIGQNDKGVNAIVNLLAQANFIKKGEDTAIYLTPHGISLVKQLLG